MNSDLGEGEGASEGFPEHDHASDPEEHYVTGGLQEIGRVEVLHILGLESGGK